MSDNAKLSPERRVEILEWRKSLYGVPGSDAVNIVDELLAYIRELERELGEAWKEMLCCDDIKLDQPLADAICDLQKAREKAEGDVVKATAAFDKYWAETCKERARADAAEASLAQVRREGMLEAGEALLKLRNEVQGLLDTCRDKLIEAHGYTNVRILEQRVAEADEIAATIRRASTPEPWESLKDPANSQGLLARITGREMNWRFWCCSECGSAEEVRWDETRCPGCGKALTAKSITKDGA